jgi:hypothetical protein
MSLEAIKIAIKKLDKKAQQELLQELPKLLGIKAETIRWLKVAEPSFAFWDNEEDAVYDNL